MIFVVQNSTPIPSSIGSFECENQQTLVRAAEIAGDVEGFRANFIKLVTETALLASHPAVQMHCEVLFRLIEALLAICPGYPMPILIDWDVVRSAVAASIRGDSGEQSFYPFVQYDFVPRCSHFGRTQPLGEVLSDGNVGRKYRSLDEDISDHASVFRAPKPEPKADIIGDA